MYTLESAKSQAFFCSIMIIIFMFFITMCFIRFDNIIKFIKELKQKEDCKTYLTKICFYGILSKKEI